MTSDEIDIEILAHRLPGDCDRRDLAKVLGLQPQSIWRGVELGTVEAPYRYNDVEISNGGSQKHAMWSSEQVVRMLLARANRPTATECSSGHEWTEANTLIKADGYRRCRACQRDNQRRYRAQHAT